MLDRIRVSSLALTLGATVLAAAAAPQMKASELDKKTVLSFSAPVEISGQTLPAGSYTFKTLDQDRDVVIVMDRDENRVFGTFLTVPIEAAQTPDKTRILFSEGPAASPEAIHAWFYPGDKLGWEFAK
jgi:hypothetical protein